eukprot:1584469-Pyramimonas_sp.AAC.1
MKLRCHLEPPQSESKRVPYYTQYASLTMFHLRMCTTMRFCDIISQSSQRTFDSSALIYIYMTQRLLLQCSACDNDQRRESEGSP